MSRKIIFITGGARSGKSRFALNLANNYPISPMLKKAYIATAEALDDEMKARIEEHKRMRGDDWDTYEEPLRIAEVIKEIGNDYRVIVVDCLTLWLSNMMHAKSDINQEIENLIAVLKNLSLITYHLSLFAVSNEVGMGIVPENELARRFRDMAGFLNQKVAEVADEVYVLVAGIPMKIKGQK